MAQTKKNLIITFISLSLLFLMQGCASLTLEASATPTHQPSSTRQPATSLPTSTEMITPTAFATEKTPPTLTLEPQVQITAVGGNLFIRRGPGLAYDPVGVLYKNTGARAIARDVLSEWVQIEMPKSRGTGWVSLQTQYSQLQGNLETLPGFTSTDWPVPAYIINCTHHRMYVLPVEVVIPSSYQFPDNQVWIYPGSYVVHDIDVAGEPEVAQVDIREGSVVEINKDGLGEHRKCP